MIALVSQVTLEAALRAAIRATAKTGIPILSNVLLETVDGALRVSSTTLEIGLVTTIEATVNLPGALAVPAKTLLETVAEIPAGTITIEAKDCHLRITCDSVRFGGRIAGIAAEEFPALPAEIADASEIEMPVADLRDLTRRVGFAASTDQTRLSLNGIYLRRVNKHAEAIATDGHRLSRLTLPGTTTSDREGSSWIIPTAPLELAELLSRDESTVRLTCGQDAGRISVEPSGPMLSCEVYSKLIGGPYPNTAQVIPRAFGWSMVFSRLDLLQIVRRVRAGGKGRASGAQIKLDRDEVGTAGQFVVHAEGDGIEAREIVVPILVEGAPPPLAWSGEYLVELLSLLEGETILLRGNGSFQATIWTANQEDPRLMTLLMPLRRSE